MALLEIEPVSLYHFTISINRKLSMNCFNEKYFQYNKDMGNNQGRITVKHLKLSSRHSIQRTWQENSAPPFSTCAPYAMHDSIEKQRWLKYLFLAFLLLRHPATFQLIHWQLPAPAYFGCSIFLHRGGKVPVKLKTPWSELNPNVAARIIQELFIYISLWRDSLHHLSDIMRHTTAEKW